MATEQLYALCTINESVEDDFVFWDLGEGEYGSLLALVVYTARDGEVQRTHLEAYDDDRFVIRPKSHEELLDAMRRNRPNSVYLDGEEIRGPVFTAMLKEALGLPIKQPRIIAPEEDYN